MTDAVNGVVWEVLDIFNNHDGDTVRLWYGRMSRVSSLLTQWLYISQHDHPEGTPIRLCWVDTPETDDHIGWQLAKTDTTGWLAEHKHELQIETFGPGGMDRELGDIFYIDDNGVRQSLSVWLMIERGWPPYTKSKEKKK